MDKIKRLIVQYENGQTDEWSGIGWLTRTNTTQQVETGEFTDEGKPKTKTVPVKTVECQLKLEVRDGT